MSIYDFNVKDINDNEVSLKEYEGKVLLIVNTASKCGFTPQFEGLEALYKKYKEKGLVILGFPCNQFAKQDPGTNKDIASFCSMNYGVTFPMFAKIDVNGENADPLYKFLRNEKKGILGSSIKWNFTKFLVDKNGKVIDKFASTKAPEELEKDIEALL